MNFSILNTKVQEFISENLNSDITKLILKGSPFKDISTQELANQIIAKKKSKDKLPTWFKKDNIYYPPKISIEQTSSEITASYKSDLINGKTIIDITGGFGVDCYYFSKKVKDVFHIEINEDLSKIVTHNFKELNSKNIKTYNNDGIRFLKENNFLFDSIYIDPSRRNDTKGKVFLLKDCLPNVPKNLDFLFTKTTKILIKNSPILDISSAIKELKFTKEIHVVALNNEVKEVLFLLEKNYNKDIEVKTINFLKNSHQKFNFILNDKVTSEYSEPLTYLYEPNVAILKSGAFHQVSKQLKVFKLEQHSHLYTSKKLVNFPGRSFKVLHTIIYDKKKINKLVSNKKANITIRNFHKSVAQIRKETKLKDGGNTYLFFTTNFKNKKIVIVTEKITS